MTTHTHTHHTLAPSQEKIRDRYSLTHPLPLVSFQPQKQKVYRSVILAMISSHEYLISTRQYKHSLPATATQACQKSFMHYVTTVVYHLQNYTAGEFLPQQLPFMQLTAVLDLLTMLQSHHPVDRTIAPVPNKALCAHTLCKNEWGNSLWERGSQHLSILYTWSK